MICSHGRIGKQKKTEKVQSYIYSSAINESMMVKRVLGSFSHACIPV